MSKKDWTFKKKKDLFEKKSTIYILTTNNLLYTSKGKTINSYKNKKTIELAYYPVS